MVDGTREKSSADHLLQKLGVVTTNAWEGERDREGGRLAQCNDCDGSQRSHHLVDTCFWTAALAFGPTSLLINIWWNKWWIFYDFFPFKFKLLWNTGAQKKKKKRTETGIYTRSSPCTSCNTSHSWGKLKGREEHPAGVAAGVLCITMLWPSTCWAQALPSRWAPARSAEPWWIIKTAPEDLVNLHSSAWKPGR